MFSHVFTPTVFLQPRDSPSWQEPAFGAVVLLLFILFAVHRLLERVVPGLSCGRTAGTDPSATASGRGQGSALSRVRGVSFPVGVGGQGGEGFLRALLVELVTRGGGRAVLSRPELHRLLGSEVEPRLLALLAFGLVVHDSPREAAEYLEHRLPDDETDFYWFLGPEHIPEPLPRHERLHVLLLAPWRPTWEISPDGLLNGETVPTLTTLEAAERLHLFSLTL